MLALGLAGLLAVLGCRQAPTPPEVPQRILALAPNLTEILFALELGDRVVGVGDWARWPPEVETLPRLGGLLDPHVEEIVELAPDLALLLPSEAELGVRLERLGIPGMEVPIETLADVGAAMIAVGARCGVAERGEELAAQWRQQLLARPVATGEELVLVVGRTPGRLGDLVVAGRESFLSELVVRLGGTNAFGDVARPYAQVGLDALVARAPERILELHGEPLTAEEEQRLREDWDELLPGTPVLIVAGDYVLVPGPRLALLYRQLAEALAESRG